MAIEIKTTKQIGLLQTFAKKIGATFDNGKIQIPKNKGFGYIYGLLLGNSIGVVIRDYSLFEDFTAIRNLHPNSPEKILMSFNNVFPSRMVDDTEKINIKTLPSIQIAKGKLNFEDFYPSHTKYSSIFISIESENLKTLIGSTLENSILSSIIKNGQTLLFEEMISPEIQKVAFEMVENRIPKDLQQLYFRLKAEELICLLFVELLKRKNPVITALNELDVQKIYEIRDHFLQNLSTPPNLKNLAQTASFSESKLKRLFKQIFGNSIFNYYQGFRMNEAARLLKEKKMSVSEVGYEMGFSNLSHFTKVFELHIGIKPKKYSSSV